MVRILFVDDEPNLLSGLKRMLWSQRHRWEMQFVAGGAEALEEMARQPADIIVSDMRMPKMDGAELLSHVHEQFPATARIGLSGYSEDALLRRGLPSIHQFLSKPCDSVRLIGLLQNLLDIGEELPEAARGAATAVHSLPCREDVLRRLEAELQQATPNLEELTELVESDLGLTCQVFRMACSGLFGTPRNLHGVAQACHFLGPSRLEQALPHLSSTPDPPPGERARHLGRLAQALGRSAGLDERLCEEARTACLLREAGSLLPVEPALARLLTPYLLSLWGLPEGVVRGVAHCEEPDRGSAESLEAADLVHLASRRLDPAAVLARARYERLGAQRILSLEVNLD